MHWLDLGWLRREDGWEFHPWGPFARGYLLGDETAEPIRRKVRLLRAGLLATCLLAFLIGWGLGCGVLLLVACGVVAGALEATGIWILLRGAPRTEGLGLQKGLFYLSYWTGPKLRTMARVLTLMLVMLSMLQVYLRPFAWRSYLFLCFFFTLLYALHLIDSAQKKRK